MENPLHVLQRAIGHAELLGMMLVWAENDAKVRKSSNFGCFIVRVRSDLAPEYYYYNEAAQISLHKNMLRCAIPKIIAREN